MEPYFEQHKDQSGSPDIDRPFYIGSLTTDQEGYHIPPHWHYHIEILYMAYGSATVTIGSQSLQLNQGELILIHPCEVHAVSVAVGTPSQHYVIGFDAELLRPMPSLQFQLGYALPYAASLHQGRTLLAMDEGTQATYLPFIQDMLTEYQSKAPGFELAVTSNIYKLLVWLLRITSNQGAQLPALPADETGNLEAFRKVLVYLNEHCHEPISAEAVAKISMMSYSRFANLFKRLMNTTLTRYILFLRLRKAELQLLDPGKSITQIALETGFNSPSYFIKHFKQAKGISPLQYRRNGLLIERRK